MQKIRRSLAVVALLATLGGTLLQGLGVGSLANTASKTHVSSSTFAVSSLSMGISKPKHWPCPAGGGSDC